MTHVWLLMRLSSLIWLIWQLVSKVISYSALSDENRLLATLMRPPLKLKTYTSQNHTKTHKKNAPKLVSRPCCCLLLLLHFVVVVVTPLTSCGDTHHTAVVVTSEHEHLSFTMVFQWFSSLFLSSQSNTNTHTHIHTHSSI